MPDPYNLYMTSQTWILLMEHASMSFKRLYFIFLRSFRKSCFQSCPEGPSQEICDPAYRQLPGPFGQVQHAAESSRWGLSSGRIELSQPSFLQKKFFIVWRQKRHDQRPFFKLFKTVFRKVEICHVCLRKHVCFKRKPWHVRPLKKIVRQRFIESRCDFKIYLSKFSPTQQVTQLEQNKVIIVLSSSAFNPTWNCHSIGIKKPNCLQICVKLINQNWLPHIIL